MNDNEHDMRIAPSKPDRLMLAETELMNTAETLKLVLQSTFMNQDTKDKVIWQLRRIEALLEYLTR